MDGRQLKVTFIMDLDSLENAFDRMEEHNIEYQCSNVTNVQAQMTYKADSKKVEKSGYDYKAADNYEKEIAELSKEMKKLDQMSDMYKRWYNDLLEKHCRVIRSLYFDKHWKVKDIASLLGEDEYKIELIVFNNTDIF